MFPFPRVCSHFGPFRKQTRAHFPTFVSFSPRLFPFWSIWETNAGKKKQKQEKVNKSKEIALAQHQASGICAYYFPLFVRDLGQIWYKVRQLVPLFVRDLGQIWYKVRQLVPLFVVRHAV
ncbi:hypothetical protein [Gardnerella vaginalis]|uniref:hypothetical protein n=1 Tax=Gardnerella vaginalis TaxID=2702 RepID=UPI0039EE39CC